MSGMERCHSGYGGSVTDVTVVRSPWPCGRTTGRREENHGQCSQGKNMTLNYVDVSENGVPQNGWFIMEDPIKMDDLGVPLFLETPMWGSEGCRVMAELHHMIFPRCVSLYDYLIWLLRWCHQPAFQYTFGFERKQAVHPPAERAKENIRIIIWDHLRWYEPICIYIYICIPLYIYIHVFFHIHIYVYFNIHIHNHEIIMTTFEATMVISFQIGEFPWNKLPPARLSIWAVETQCFLRGSWRDQGDQKSYTHFGVTPRWLFCKGNSTQNGLTHTPGD